MPIKPFRNIPRDLIEWARFLVSAEVEPSEGTITNETFANRTANSIVGRPQSTAGSPSDIAIPTNKFLTNRSGTVQADTLIDSDIPSGVARDTEVAAADLVVIAGYQAADAAHVAAGDPHPQYLTAAEGNAAYQPLAAVLSMLHTGTGSPEGVLTAPVPHLYLRSDGGASTTLYVKESGSGNTGWVAK